MKNQTVTRHGPYRNTRYFFTSSLLLLVFLSCGRIPSLPPLAEDAVVLAFGDSLTYGTGASKENDFPSILAELTSMKIINAGVPGEITAGGVKRLPKLLDRHSPALLILVHGGNDFLRKKPESDTIKNIESMIDAAQQREIPVVMLGVPKPGLFLTSARLYQVLADEKNIPINTHVIPAILADRQLKSDAIHPNDEGYRLIAKAIYATLQKHDAL